MQFLVLAHRALNFFSEFDVDRPCTFQDGLMEVFFFAALATVVLLQLSFTLYFDIALVVVSHLGQHYHVKDQLYDPA